MGTKIQKLLENWPQGAIKTVYSLKAQGYSQSLINHYRKSAWIKSIGEGVVIKAGDKVSVFSAIATMQSDLKIDVRIGGITALELQGKSHFVRRGKTSFHLFGSPKRLPAWFRNYEWEEDIKYHSTSLFKKGLKTGLTDFNSEGLSLLISNEIQAMLEFLSLVPMFHTVEEASKLMEGLSTIVPVKAQQLLEECNSYKVRRLFLLLADEFDHPWFKRLKTESIDLGKGDMSLTKGGQYSQKYKLVVPKSIFRQENR